MSDLVEIAQAAGDRPIDAVLADVHLRDAAVIGVIPQLDALNSFIRSEAHRRASVVSSLPKVVYHYKREALCELTRMQQATHRLVATSTKCRDCGGSRCYTDMNGYTHDHCWKCSSTGRVTLRFIESTIRGTTVWHTPITDAYTFIRDTSEMKEYPVLDWKVHMPGIDMTPSEVATALCDVEMVFTTRPRDIYDYHTRSLHDTYTIWIGETPRDSCLICGNTRGAPHCCHILRTGRLHWGGSVCKKCREVDDGSELRDALARLLPDSLITPAIRVWVERHPTQADPTPIYYGQPPRCTWDPRDSVPDAQPAEEIPF